MQIVFLDESTVILNDDVDFSALKSLGTYTSYPNTSPKQTVERSKDVEIAITNKVLFAREVISQLPKLKLICVIATGYNNVDIEAAKELNVRVCNIPGYATASVVQHTFALILNLATKAHIYHNDIQNGAWQNSTSFTLLTYPTFELEGKTIGIIGFGTIGRGVARLAEGFGMKVLAYKRSPIKDAGYSNTDLDTLLRESDVVTVHCPLNKDSRDLIDTAAIAKMKKTAILINTARGGIVNEEALADALNSGTIAAAGIDVLTQEPPKNENPLLNAKNIIITPHSAWSTVQARQRLMDQTALNIKAFIAGTQVNVII